MQGAREGWRFSKEEQHCQKSAFSQATARL